MKTHIDTGTIWTIRKEFEENIINKRILIRIYQRYMQNITQFINIALSQFPKLNCGVASVYVQHVLQSGIIIHGRYNGHTHTFLQIGNEIIDITADQYDGPKVYIGGMKNPWQSSNTIYA